MMFKNPYKNLVIIIIILLLWKINYSYLGFSLWFFSDFTFFKYLAPILIALCALINGVYFIKKHIFIGVMQILFIIYISMFVFFIYYDRYTILEDIIAVESSYKVNVFSNSRIDYFYFIQKDRFLYFFAKEHCIYAYRIYPQMTGWEKLDNETLKINNVALTLTKNIFSNNVYTCIDDDGRIIYFDKYTFKNIIYFTKFLIRLII